MTGDRSKSRFNKINKHFHELKLLEKGKPKIRKSILEAGSCFLVNCIAEIVLNHLQNRIPVPESAKRKLRPYRAILRKIAYTKRNPSQKKKILVQKGGFLPMLLGSLFSSLASTVLPKLFGK